MTRAGGSARRMRERRAGVLQPGRQLDDVIRGTWDALEAQAEESDALRSSVGCLLVALAVTLFTVSILMFSS